MNRKSDLRDDTEPFPYLVVNGGIQFGRLVPAQKEEFIADGIVDVDARL